jgi:hypothetical protein
MKAQKHLNDTPFIRKHILTLKFGFFINKISLTNYFLSPLSFFSYPSIQELKNIRKIKF